MKGSPLLLLTIILLSSCHTARYIFPTDLHVKDSPVPPAPDYSKDIYWASLPAKTNPAGDTPDTLKNNQVTAEADVFFVYPTTFTGKPQNQYQWNADVNDERINNKTDKSTIRYQASIFNGSCRVYAPRYRQAHLYAFFTNDKNDKYQSLGIAYSDVKVAFEYYLQHYNKGRPIIIAGHSQGTIYAYRLLRDFFDGKELSKQLVAAYLVGMPVPRDSFKLLQPCAHPQDVDCYCTWNTFAFNYYPTYYLSGLNHAVCTNPLTWTLDTTYVPRDKNPGGVLKNFNKILPALCDAQVHNGLLWVSQPHFFGSRLFHWKIYHIVDYNLFYMSVRENVAERVHFYLVPRN